MNSDLKNKVINCFKYPRQIPKTSTAVYILNVHSNEVEEAIKIAKIYNFIFDDITIEPEINGTIELYFHKYNVFNKSYEEEYYNKPLIIKLPKPNVFITPIVDNRDQILQKIQKELDYNLEFTRTYLPNDGR